MHARHNVGAQQIRGLGSKAERDGPVHRLESGLPFLLMIENERQIEEGLRLVGREPRAGFELGLGG